MVSCAPPPPPSRNPWQVIRKDIAFARLFGSRPPSALPLPSYGLFALRDAHTVGASFLLPPIVAEWFMRQGWFEKRSHAEVGRPCVPTHTHTPTGSPSPVPPLRPSPRLGVALTNGWTSPPPSLHVPHTLVCQVAAQLVSPAAVQFLSTPYHLLALDLYNRPGATVTWKDRVALIREKCVGMLGWLGLAPVLAAWGGMGTWGGGGD
jgi:hypothetical protein